MVKSSGERARTRCHRLPHPNKFVRLDRIRPQLIVRDPTGGSQSLRHGCFLAAMLRRRQCGKVALQCLDAVTLCGGNRRHGRFDPLRPTDFHGSCPSVGITPVAQFRTTIRAARTTATSTRRHDNTPSAPAGATWWSVATACPRTPTHSAIDSAQREQRDPPGDGQTDHQFRAALR